VHAPPLVFLDEPTAGLDPQSRSNLWEHIGRLRSDLGTTVFLTTRYLEEADVLCDRVFIISLLVKSEDPFAPLINTVVVPLLVMSGIFLPLTLGPGWLQGIARVSPFRYVINAMRQAYEGHYFNTIMVEGIAVAVGMAVIFLWLGSRVFLRENA
jgi:hypothetical protein